MNLPMNVETPSKHIDDLERRIETVSQELAASQAELARTREAATVGHLGARVAHDLNNILTAVIANIDLLEAQLEGASDAASLAHEALTAALRGAELVRGYLAVAGHVAMGAEPDRAPEMRQAGTRETAASPEQAGGGETILAVDDDPAILKIVARQLRESGYRVLEAEDGPAALMLLNDERVDLLFTDVVMPGGMSGYDLARLVLSRWPHMKALVTSAFPEMVPTGASIGQGKLQRLIKPYRKPDLIAALHAALAS